MFEAFLNGCFQPQAIAQFLPNPFVNNYVGVYGHTDGQYDTRNTGQSQNGTQRSHCTKQQEDVDDQGQDSHDTSTCIIRYHERQDRNKGNHQSAETFIDV